MVYLFGADEKKRWWANTKTGGGGLGGPDPPEYFWPDMENGALWGIFRQFTSA